MRRVLLFALMVLLLWGCAAQEPAPAYITVSLTLPEGCDVVENGLQILSGEDAVFELKMEEGYSLASVDYDGTYTAEVKGSRVALRLESVRYPAMVAVTVTSQYCSITYNSNGAGIPDETCVYDRSEHIRPNTSIGTDIFTRDGYTLTGWNTEPDGSGTAVGLGSRVSVPDGTLTLYAQWAKWSADSLFDWVVTDTGAAITGYHGTEDTVVVPGTLDGSLVTLIAQYTFLNSTMTHVILPPTITTLQESAFSGCSQLRELTFFDNIEQFSDLSFVLCPEFSTVHINAIEAPYGFNYRRESCLADKMDILIEAQGNRKIVFYGGCSMWYNLDGAMAQEAIGEGYQVINMGLNGVTNSAIQMQILTYFLEDGDIFFHTPEISSQAQLMLRTEMINHDRKLWCGLEYNYDLVSLVDIRTLPEFFDIYYYWLSKKECTSSYTDMYRDSRGNDYVDEYGCASFLRVGSAEELADKVYLDPSYIDPNAMQLLESYYQAIMDRGVTVYVDYACMNLDAVPAEQADNAELMDNLFREAISEMEGVTVLGTLMEHLYHNDNFYDTNYHLQTEEAQENTRLWLEDLLEQMALDGLLTE